MDSDAKQIAVSHIENDIPPITHSPSDLGLGTITCGTTLITSSIQSSLYTAVTHRKMMKWLSCHGEDPSDLISISIYWKSFSKARKEVSLQTKLFITKWLSGDTATGKVMYRRKQRSTSFCPRCGRDNEHLMHVLICPSEEAIKLREKLLSELIVWFKDNHTHPNITLFFQLGLRKWFKDQTYQWKTESQFFLMNMIPTSHFKLNFRLVGTTCFVVCLLKVLSLFNKDSTMT